MLAFEVYVHRLPEPDASGKVSRDEQLMNSESGELLTHWTISAYPGCLGWIDELADQGKAKQLKGNGYPMLYVGNTEAIIEALYASEASYAGLGITPEIEAKLNACRQDEALVVEAWDLS